MMNDITDRWRTAAIEDFLKAVYLLQQDSERVSTGSLAESLQVSSATVTDTIKRLAGMEVTMKGQSVPESLLEYERYYGVRLTDCGVRIALDVIRRHRLIELYLCIILGYTWDEVHEEADRLEHAVSEKFVACIAAALDHPERDPHGDPIPSADGLLPINEAQPLAMLPQNQRLCITRILDQSADTLRRLSELGLEPGSLLQIAHQSLIHDTITLLVDGEEITISQRIADGIMAQHCSILTTQTLLDSLQVSD